MDVADLKAKIRDIKDFPTEGILFKDITTLLKDGPAFRYVVDAFVRRYQHERVDVVVGIESRGFVIGGALAHQLNAGFVPVRKLGKLPGKTVEVEGPAVVESWAERVAAEHGYSDVSHTLEIFGTCGDH